MQLFSSVFSYGESIPKKYTCEGENISPPLEFREVPPTAVSLVLLVEDPDVPHKLRADGMWDHWVVFNIPPQTRLLSEGTVPPGLQGRNTSDQQSYEGPCPPDREHRYFFTLYALDKMLDLKAGVSKKEVEKAMQGHVLSQASLIGLYQKVQ